MNTVATNSSKIIYWHRELPPFDADAMAEHVIEATSNRVPGTLVHRDELWGQCYETLMASAATRLEQEVARLGGQYARTSSMNRSTVGMTELPVKPGCTVASPTCCTVGR